MDFPHLCRSFDGGGFQCAVPEKSGQGPDRSFGRLRSADTDRLRFRPHPRQRRGRQGRRADLPSRRYASVVRRHPARHDEHLDDHQCHRRVADGALHRGCRRTRRAAGEPSGHAAERHHQGVPLARHVRFPAGSVDAADQGRDPVHDQRDSEMESDQRLLVSPSGSGRHAGARACLRTRDSNRRARYCEDLRRGAARQVRRGRRPHLVLRQRGPALHHRTLQDARLHRAVGRGYA